MSKGSTYRPVDPAKWDRGWLRIWGMKCPMCRGSGGTGNIVQGMEEPCPACDGCGYISNPKGRRSK
jgi:hypothetical protein